MMPMNKRGDHSIDTLTIREYFASLAVAGFSAKAWSDNARVTARHAVAVADELLIALSETGPHKPI